jgi:hypothetical protein
MIEAGFCGGYAAKGGKTRGHLRYILDEIAAGCWFLGCEYEAQRIQLCNQKVVSYEDQPFFHRCLEGLNNNGAYFHKADHEFVHDSVYSPQAGAEISFYAIRDKNVGAFIEPVYDYVAMESYVPMHSLIAAYLMGLTGEIQVDCISVMSGPFSTKRWPIVTSEIESLLAGWRMSATGTRRPSGACASCTQSTCTFQSDFDHLTYDWMKAKANVSDIEAKIRQHITYNGPTKVGAHLVYMKENKRRSLDPEKRDAFLELLKKERPQDWVDFLNPDAAELFKLAAQGKITKELLRAFKESRYYTLDTTLTL